MGARAAAAAAAALLGLVLAPGAGLGRPPALARGRVATTRLGMSTAVQDEVGDADYELRYAALGRLYGAPAAARLRDARVLVIGVGGVGSWAAEALARSGVAALTLMDFDDICVSNTNRQVHALTSTVGRLKVDALAERLRDANPHVAIDTVPDFASRDTLPGLGLGGYDCVLDAVDSMEDKVDIVRACVAAGVPLVVAGAAGDRADPTKVRVGDIANVRGDKLLGRVRKRLRQSHGFPRANGEVKARGEGAQIAPGKGKKNKPAVEWGVATVYSLEAASPVKVCSAGAPGAPPQAQSCDATFGTACFAVGAFGFAAAATVVDEIIGSKSLKQRKKAGLPTVFECDDVASVGDVAAGA